MQPVVVGSSFSRVQKPHGRREAGACTLGHRIPARPIRNQGCQNGAHISLDTHSRRLITSPDNVPAPIPPAPAVMTTQAVSASISLIKVINWDGTSQDINQVLTAAFDAEDYLDCIKNLRERNIDPLSYINRLDKVSPYSIPKHHARFMTIWQQIIDNLPIDSELRKRCLRALRKTCGLYGILPDSYTIPSNLTKPGPRQRPFASGGFSDVWKLPEERNQDRIFAVKSLRVYEQDPSEKINKV